MVDTNSDIIVFCILEHIHKVYVALHPDTDTVPMQFMQFSASTDDYDLLDDVILSRVSSFPLCKVSDHRSDSAPHIYHDYAPTTLAYAIPHNHNNTAFTPSIAGPYQPSSSTHAPLPVNETFTYALPLDDQLSIPGSTQHIGQMTTESRNIPPTSPSLVTAYPTHLSASEPSTSGTSPKSNTSASPPDSVAVGLSRVPSVDLNVLPSPSPPVFDATFPTGLWLFSGRDSI